MAEKFSLEWQIEEMRNQFDKFKIESVEKTDNMMLIKARVDFTVYFAFYSKFIVCSGDYGEWQFDTTWKTLVNGKPKISLNFHYLLGKLSSDCKKFDFDSECCNYQLNKWKEKFLEEIKEDYENEDVDFKEFLSNFNVYFESINTDDENSYISTLREFADFLEENGFSDTFEYEFWDFGKLYIWQLVGQLVMFEKIVEYFKEEK